MSTVLSIDVGIINLGVCIYKKGEGIKKWEVLTLKKECIVESLRKEIDRFIGEEKIDKVVIEKQPSRNVKMRTIEGMIEMYCEMKEPKLKAIKYSAKYKLKSQNIEIRGKHNYRERKMLSIEVVKQIIEGEEKWKEYYEKSKKKDDLADALLQGMSYVGEEIPELKKENITRKITSRKPTKNQEKKGYSINNIKYFFSNFDIEECKKDNKIKKAVENDSFS